MTGPSDCAERAADADDRKQAMRLFGIEKIGHEAPEHRHHEQVEHADPDEEHRAEQTRADRVLDTEQGNERKHAGDEEQIHQRHENPSRETRDQRAEQRRQRERRDERGHIEGRKRCGTDRRGKLVAHRSDHVVRGQYAEEIRERDGNGEPFVALDGGAIRQARSGSGSAESLACAYNATGGAA